ncbi:MAG: 2-oxoglutarate dehydrogenase E1 component [Pirellulales bacterium]|nr:2-oxoglutarate dehydrogenase E1 component [Pirellulales bacterium]
MSNQLPLPGSMNLPFVEELYDRYLANPHSVSADWRQYFQQLSSGDGHRPRRSLPSPPALPSAKAESNGAVGLGGMDVALLQDRVDQLIRAYRVRGHMIAQIDPLGLPRPTPVELDMEYYGLTDRDLDRPFSTDTIHGEDVRPLRKILEQLRNTYCRRIGAQFMHMDDLAVRNWLQDRMESTQNRLKLAHAEQIRIFTRLTDAVIFEEFLRKRYLGAKTFSLEGAESLIPLLDLAIDHAAELGVGEIVLGMAHRGRLNVLANIMGKNARKIFREFDDADPELHIGRGDVKYHLGYSSDWKSASGKNVHLSLCFNPSHLEFVNPVALGRMRAKQDRLLDNTRRQGMVVLIHGDAAFAGEGVVQETLNLSELDGYTTGGTIHVVVNNQIGFTTSPSEARSSTYATDVAKMLQIPIFHVNGEDPEAVAQAVRLSLDFRQKFQRDVVIDMYCYRRRGHNEGDEPSFTQPVMYHAIENRDSVRDYYLEHLLLLGEVTVDEADRIAEERRAHLETELSVARSEDYVHAEEQTTGIWHGYHGGPENEAGEIDTGVPAEQLSQLLLRQTEMPADFHVHPKIQRLLAHRVEMAHGQAKLDWSAGEALALATLATAGHPIRLSGQDVERGTFSHRHAVLHDYDTGKPYMPLAHLADPQAPVDIFNSPLSEIGVLGYEYGYSLDCPDGLVLWEAQFGDFVNVAQVIIDQFIASAEDKWRRLSGLVLLLPHSFEGQGPEHSSARLERFLQLCAEDNMQVANPSTPAQYFHVLRRQVLRTWRKPLVLMTPKSLLRHPKAVSSLEEFARGHFQRVIPDATVGGGSPSRVLLCSGKVYYELEQARSEHDRDDVAIVRLEQIYPTPWDELARVLSRYEEGTPVLWVQEEPENMGAWRYLKVVVGDTLLGRFPFSGVYRPTSASPATGSANSHKLEQRTLLTTAFAELATGHLV